MGVQKYVFKRNDVISNKPNLTKTFPKCRLSDSGLTILESIRISIGYFIWPKLIQPLRLHINTDSKIVI